MAARRLTGAFVAVLLSLGAGGIACGAPQEVRDVQEEVDDARRDVEKAGEKVKREVDKARRDY